MSDSEAKTVKTARPIKRVDRQQPQSQRPRPVRSNVDQQRALVSGRFQASEYARACFDVVLPANWDYEDTLRPGFWANVCHLLKRNPVSGEPSRQGALIDVGTEDHAFFAKLYVRAVLKAGLVVQCIGPSIDPRTGKACPIDIETGLAWQGRKDVESGVFDIRWNGTAFDIVTRDTEQTIAENFATRELATEWVSKTKAA